MHTITHIFFFFFFNDTATTEIYTLSLHDALPIYLRATVRPGVVCGSPDRLRRCRNNQISDAGNLDPRHGTSVRALWNCAPRMDGSLPDTDGGNLQPARFHHRPVGRQFRAAAGCAAHDRHAAHLPRRRVLLDQHAASDMAED